MRAQRAAAVVAAIGGLTLAMAGPAAASGLGQAPDVCATGPDLSCLTKGGGGDTTVSPELVRVGQVVTFKLTPDGTGIAALPKGWTIQSRTVGNGTAPAMHLLGCKYKQHKFDGGPYDAGEVLGGPAICRYRITSSGRGWQAAVASFAVTYGNLASYSEAAWRVVPKGGYIEGHIRGKPTTRKSDGTPINNMQVSARGPSYASTKTNNEGYYALELPKPGKYKVSPELRASDRKLKPDPTFDHASRSVTLDGKDLKDVDFKLKRGDGISITFRAGEKEISSIPANGVASATAQVSAFDANDDPITGQPLDIVVDDARLGTKAVVCDSNNSRLWPGDLTGTTRSAQTFSGGDTSTTPDGNGHLNLTVFAGTEAGSVTITARRQGASAMEKDESATLRLSSPNGLRDLASAAKYAKSNFPNGYPSPAPINADAESTWQMRDIQYLEQAKLAGQFSGWEYAPVRTSDSTRYGIYFYKNGSQGSGGVLETTNAGFGRLESGGALPSLGAWAGGGYTVNHMSTGYPGDDLFYLGWPYEGTPADTCIRRAPN